MAVVPRTEIYGRFEVLEQLGIGGMATVHRAIERGADGSERVVALKRPLPRLGGNKGFLRTFVREANVAAMLRHASIVEIYELGQVGDRYFIAMEYIPGRDLRVILRQARHVCGPPPVNVALALLLELLDALDYAHERCGPDGMSLGIVHRDISPSNLIVSHTGHLKVIDFGIARATLGHLTNRTGRIKGKLAYMAPEALSGALDRRSDLFSASVTAHEMVTALPLFAGQTDLQTIERLQHMQPPPPSARNPGSWPELDEIILRGLAKDPDQRWGSAAEMRAALIDLVVPHHEPASGREVSEWVKRAFEMPLPARRRLLAAGAGRPAARGRRSAAEADSDEQTMTIARAVAGQRPAAAAEPGGDDGPTVAMAVAPADPVLPSAEGAAAEAGSGRAHAPVQHAEWVDTGPTILDPPHEMMAQIAELAAQRAAHRSATGIRAVAVGRRWPPLPLLVATAVAAGAAIAWAASGGGERASSEVFAAGHTAEARATSGSAKAVGNAAAGEPRGPRPAPEAPGGYGATSDDQPSRLLSASPYRASGPSRDTTRRASGTSPGAQPPSGREAAANRRGARAAYPPGKALALGRDELDDNDVGAPLDRAGSPVAAARRVGAASRLARGGFSLQAEVQSLLAGKLAVRSPAGSDAAAGGAGPPSNRARSLPDRPAQGPVPARTDSSASEVAPAPTRGGAGEALRAPSPPQQPIVVAASRTHRTSGSVPPLQIAAGERVPPELTAKLCIDQTGGVTSVAVVSDVSRALHAALRRALSAWRYEPVVDGDRAVPACFATTFRLELR